MAMPYNMAESLGLKLGDRFPLQTRVVRKDGSTTWEFQLVALFEDVDNPGKAAFTVINYDYLNESRVDNIDTLDRIIARIADPTRSAQVAAQVDALFANSSHETRSQNEKEITESSIQQLGDIAFFTRAVIGAVFFALLFVTGNTMMQSVRERMNAVSASPRSWKLKQIGRMRFTLAAAMSRCPATRSVSRCRTPRSSVV